MRIVGKLVLADFRQHPARVVLTSLAVIAAACVVVWVVSGYDALLAQFDEFASEYLGRYELVVVPPAPRQAMMPGAFDRPPIPAQLISALKRDPAVAALEPVAQSRVMVMLPDRAEGRPRFPLGRPRLALEGTNAAKPPYEIAEGRWIDFRRPDRMEAALSRRTAEQLEVGAGNSLQVESEAGKFRLKIVGLLEQVSLGGAARDRRGPMGPSRGPSTSALYVPIALAEKINGKPAEISFVNVALKDGVDVVQFRAKWLSQIAKKKYPATLLALGDVETELKEGRFAARIKKQAYSATGISLLATLFIIFTTLSMGVHERIRQFAMLRAIALTRAQVACMIAAEGLMLAVIGWLGGLAAGWGLLWITSRAQGELFRGGESLGAWAVLLSGLCAFGGALAASILPAWKATHISPLEAMMPCRIARPARWSWLAVAAGAGLIAVNPLLVFVVPMADDARYGIYAALGCTSMAIGFVLLAPLAILATEKILGPLVAKSLRLEERLLSTQLTSNLGRTLGTTVALSLGLGLYVATQTWGHSMLRPFVPGDWAPEMLVAFPQGGLPDSEIEHVRHLPGVIAEECLPLAVEQPKLADDLTGSRRRATVTRQDNVVMIGLDPQAGLGDPNPLLPLEFVEGTQADAVAQLKQGRSCIIPDHFQRETGLDIGDRFRLVPPDSPQQPVEYAVAGVVSLPGWHWMTKFSGLRRRSGRSAAMVFASFDQVRRDFHLDQVNFFWLNTDKSVRLEDVGKALQPIAERNLGRRQPVNAQGTWPVGATMFGRSVRITTVDGIRRRIGTRSDAMIWGMCQLPLVTLAVTALGVVNAVLASVRARRWEMGVLRAVGVTRLGLIRLVFAEALLIGLVACLLSLGFGVTAGWCGTGISQYVSFFGGMEPGLIVPWGKLAIGFTATLMLCLAAALWPAVSTGWTEPLKLLKAGRTAL